jgi:hypothetical protein
MSTTSRQILTNTQEDAYRRILAHGALDTVSVVKEERGATAAEVQKILSARTARGGKVGLCILVPRPMFVPGGNDASLRGQLVQTFTVLEHPTLNAGDLGTGLSAEEVALELLQLFSDAPVGSDSQQAWSAFPGGPVVPDDSFEGFNGWEVRMQTFLGIPRDARCGLPLIDPDTGAGSQTIAITCGTAGAAIYYTLDGTYPYAGNAAAVLYSAPFVPGVGKRVRAAAFKSGYQQSGVAEVTFT